MSKTAQIVVIILSIFFISSAIRYLGINTAHVIGLPDGTILLLCVAITTVVAALSWGNIRKRRKR